MDHVIAMLRKFGRDFVNIREITAHNDIVFAIRFFAGYQAVDIEALIGKDSRQVAYDADLVIDLDCEAGLAIRETHDIDKGMENIGRRSWQR